MKKKFEYNELQTISTYLMSASVRYAEFVKELKDSDNTGGAIESIIEQFEKQSKEAKQFAMAFSEAESGEIVYE